MEKKLTNEELDSFLSDQYRDSDLVSGIEMVGILFSEEALPRLIQIIQSEKWLPETRRQAALAIRSIGAESVV